MSDDRQDVPDLSRFQGFGTRKLAARNTEHPNMFGKSAVPNGASKPSGMEMMVQSILKSMGVSPDALVLYIEQGKQLAAQFVGAMQATHQGIQQIRAEQIVQRAMLERLLGERNVPQTEVIFPTPEQDTAQ